MKKTLLALLVLMLLLPAAGKASEGPPPHYEKYGNIAIAVVRTDYPGTSVTDYEFLGRKKSGNGIAVDSFLFLIKDKGIEKNVLIKAEHSLISQNLISLYVTEAPFNQK
ncbi:Protein of unknown function [Bacillus sp. OV322]|uniref:DUF3889 domain-containing protein n=1 Tax=Bacillus sp. OV322 TaxID=1882764 RepID=UPI0008EC5809|nr:DUF3889 domain-containing protein [Bacillus sp. OV322]SFB93312.1 Protein of unknown function [Bacillus sp. OV322]